MNRRADAPVVLELAAALLVPAAVLGFSRVFSTGDAITPIIGTSLLSTAVAALLRRLRVPLSLSALVSAALLAVLVMNQFAAGTARFGVIPTGATGEQIRELISQLIANFQELRTPVPALPPFVAASMVSAWVMAFLTDWGGLRLRLAFEPVLPAGLLFIFSAVLGAGVNELPVTFMFAGAIAFWAITQRTIHLAEGNDWLAADRRRGSAGIAQAAGLLAVVALIAGVILGPRLPYASSPEMISFRDAGDPTRVVISPYVNIEQRLVDQTNVELFTVTSDQPEYWRLAGLDNYEDNIWKVAGNFSAENGRLPGQTTLGGERVEFQQDVSISAMDSIWLPAAFAPTELNGASLNGADAEVTWNADTSSLTVANEIETSDGLEYSLLSSVPNFTIDELRNASPFIPPEIAERHLTVPPLPDIVAAEAERAAAGATTRYDQMLALQNYFQTDFDYSVDLSPREGDPIEQFLTERVGFCQQFAGTFALMARQLGAPARVAIGFTWGDPIATTEDGRTTYRVTGRQAHAWPEVWFDGLGWVAFEPTPGRGSPSTANYTGMPAVQDSLVQPDNPGGPTTTVPGQELAPNPIVPPDLEGGPNFDAGETGETGALPATDGGNPWRQRLLSVFGAVAVVGLIIAGPPLWYQFRRTRRHQRATTPVARVEAAWADATESLDLGYSLTRNPSETRREFAQRLSSDQRVPGPALTRLADLTTVARYHPLGLTDQAAGEAAELGDGIHRSVRERVSLFTLWQRMVSPHRLLGSSSRMSVTTSSAADRPPSTTEAPPELNGSGPYPDRDRTLAGRR